MRISREIRLFLTSIIRKALPNSEIYLFGSRADDNRKGGDIDVLVLDEHTLTLRQKLEITAAFHKECGDQKLDIVSFTHKDTHPFKKIALTSAVPL